MIDQVTKKLHQNKNKCTPKIGTWCAPSAPSARPPPVPRRQGGRLVGLTAQHETQQHIVTLEIYGF